MMKRFMIQVRKHPTLKPPCYNCCRRYVTYRRFGDTHSSSSNPLTWALPSRHGAAAGGFRQVPVWMWWMGAGCIVYYVTHLEQVEETGRWRFMDTSVDQELAMGDEAYRSTLLEYQHRLLPSYHPTSKYVQRIADRLIEASNLPNNGEQATKGRQMEWKVHVIDDSSTQNAFVLPGGKIFVFTGILPLCSNADGLATILSHEISHQVARHSAERLSYVKVLFVITGLLSGIGLGNGFSQALVEVVLELPNSRTTEAEADRIGLNMMARACFDPREAEQLWKRLDEVERGSFSLEFLQTHPANSSRRSKIREWMQVAQKQREAHCGVASSGFQDAVRRTSWV